MNKSFIRKRRVVVSKSVSEAARAGCPARRGERGREPSGQFLAGELNRVFSYRYPKRLAFTQLELVVTIGIASIIILGVGIWQADIFRFNTMLSGQLTSQHEARQSILTMVHELRTVVTADTGAYPLESLTSTQIAFFSDIDETPDVERIRYFLQGSTLKKGVTKPSGNPVTYTGSETITNLANSIVNGATPIFTYYNSSYAGTGSPLILPVDPNVVRYVGISLIIDKDTTRPPTAIRVMGGVNLRNLKDNL